MIEVDRQQSGALDGGLGEIASTLGGEDDTKTTIQTEVSILQSDALGLETLRRTQFEKHRRSAWRFLGGSDRPRSEAGLPLEQAPTARERLLKAFERRLTITPVPNTRLIQISFEDANPRNAAETANALIEQYIQDKMGRRNASALQSSQWMAGQIDDLNRRVQTAQQRLIDYQQRSGLIVVPTVDPSREGDAPALHSSALDRLVQLNQQLVAAQATRITREAIYRVAKSRDLNALSSLAETQISAAGDGATEAASGILSGLMDLRQQQNALKIQFAAAVQTYGTKNPHLADLERQLKETDQLLRDEVSRIVSRSQLDYEMAQRTEDGIRRAYESQEHEADKLNDSQIRLAVLEQEATSTRTLYEDLYTRLQETRLSVGTQASNIEIISGALPPAGPAHPKQILNIVIGLVAGLFLGMIFAFVRDSLDDSIGSSVEVEALTGVPVLASIPQFDCIAKQGTAQPPTAEKRAVPCEGGGWLIAQPHSQPSEAFRELRTSILLSHPGSPPRTLLVTSCLPSEGKTTLSYNLGVCFAQLGRRVLVIDADMRKPALHKHISGSNRTGLSNLLTSTAPPDEYILADPAVQNLSILSSGPVPPNPTELLASEAFAALLDRLSVQYDLLIVDSPPAMLVADASIVSTMVDGVVLVARAGNTTRPAMLRVTENLRRHKASLLGFALNGVNTRSADYYYANGYYGRDYYSKNSDGHKNT